MKLFALTLVFVGVCLFFSSGSMVAADVNCPKGDVTPDNWGTNATDGPMDHGFGAVAVHSYYYDLSSGKLKQLNVKYHLNSSLEHVGNPSYNIPGEVSNPDARIFQMPIPGGGRVQERWFGTGGSSGDKLYAAPSAPDTCPGWDELGVGTQGAIGNRFLLDCQEIDTQGTIHNNRFWIDQITAPDDPAATRYGGEWKVEVSTDGSGLGSRKMPMNYDNNFFAVVNGSNIRLNLEWVPNPPPPPKPISYPTGGSCSSLSIANNETERGGNRWRKYVEVTGISLGKQRDNDDASTDVTYGPNTPNAPGQPPGDPGGPGRPSSFGVSPTAWVGGNENGLGPGDGSQSKQWFFIPWNSTTIHVKQTIQEFTDKTADGKANPTWNLVGTYYLATNGLWSTNDQSVDCYKATCTIDSATGDAGGIVKVGGLIHVRATLRNTSNNSLQLWNSSLTSSDGVDHGSDSVLDVGDTYPFTFDVRAPPTVQTFNFSAYPVEKMGTTALRAGPDCPGSVNVYEPFTLVPQAIAKPTGTTENPGTINYSTGIINKSSTDVSASTTSSFRVIPYSGAKQCSEVGPLNSNGPYHPSPGPDYPPTNTINGSCTPPIVNAGDQFCSTITLNNYNQGWVGPGGVVAETQLMDSSTTPLIANQCVKVINQPYAHFFGNDVSAGGGFGNSCQKNQKGVIYTYNNKDAGKGGAGTQFGAHAMEIISGLSSASLRGSSPVGLSGLSFANTTTTVGAPNQTTGGYLGDDGLSNFCVPDYFNDKPALLSTNPDVPLTKDTASSTVTVGGTPNKRWYNPGGTGTGTLTINGGTIGNTVNQAIFVEGNVYIANDIKYSTDPRTNITDIPSFYLVVKNGNIRIGPNVKQLDGVYVAQPDTSTSTKLNQTGIINTCFIGNNFADIYNSCKNQLVVNGAFVANRVLLARSYSSLRFSQNGEYNMGGYAAHNCGNAGKDVPAGSTSAADCAAEIFNFSPELYMSQPAINARYGPPSGKYDAITSLSPVL